jgi:exodeoxyribonuclease-3
MKITTWNVNSVRPRLQHLLDFLQQEQPDILCLQELKCERDKFPFMEVEELGYQCAVHGQKTYNGVAILSKYQLDDVITTFDNNPDETQARYIEAVVNLPHGAMRVASIYVPNGQDPQSEKFTYKLAFLDALQNHIHTILGYREVLVLGGDYNIAPEPMDVYDPKSWDGQVCFHPEERKRFRTLQHLGLYDAWRTKHPHDTAYSWWDYRGDSFRFDKGLRIDHLLLSPEATDKMTDAIIHRNTRDQEKPSDHAPVSVVLNIL